jgi:predicted nuclease with TOPRIM domain
MPWRDELEKEKEFRKEASDLKNKRKAAEKKAKKMEKEIEELSEKFEKYEIARIRTEISMNKSSIAWWKELVRSYHEVI